MIKKYILLCLLFQMSITNGQESIKQYVTSLNTTNIDPKKIEKLIEILQQKEQALAQAKQWQEEEARSPMTFLHHDELKPSHISRKFSKLLAQLLTMEQFKQLFEPQLEKRIHQIANNSWVIAKEKYKLNPTQANQFLELLKKNAAKQVIIREYNNYDNDFSWNYEQEEKLKGEDRERVLIESFGMTYSKDTKTDLLIKKLQLAQVDKKRINKIIQLFQEEEQKLNARGIAWRKNITTNAHYFDDEADTEYKIKMELREAMGKVLSYEEFKIAFQEQMQNPIHRETNNAFNELKEAYEGLEETQFEVIKTLVCEKFTERVVTEQYYKYDWDLYHQKWRAVDYKYNQLIKDKLQEFVDQIPIEKLQQIQKESKVKNNNNNSNLKAIK